MSKLPTIIMIVLSVIASAGCESGRSGGNSTPPLSGLDQRPANTTCIAGKRPIAGAGVIQLVRAFPALSFSEPLVMVQTPDSNDRWYVAEKTGNIYWFANDDATLQKNSFLNLTAKVNPSGEGGLLGMAFHPDYKNNGHVFLSFTTNNSNNQFASQISRFTVNSAGTALDSTSELMIIQLRQPYTNHNGGNIAFGPDGFLYFGLGDGGSGGDPENHGQDTRTLLGAMLRIDVNTASQSERYKIPSDNPFSGAPTCSAGLCPDQAFAASAQRCAGNGCPEIFAWGLRNPWRWSFDRSTGDLWAGDVGQYAWEEVDLIQKNKNYGWGCYEGKHRYTDTNSKDASICPATLDHTFPVVEYDHSAGQAITGGYVYRGAAIPALTGNYIFSDSGSGGKIWALADPKSTTPTMTELANTGYSIVSFGEGHDGELYVLDYSGGIYKLVPGTTATPVAFPAKLSETGCAGEINRKDGSPGMIPFALNSPLWSDSADKKRWLALPDNTAINIESGHDWTLPPGSILRKDFYLDAKIVETRLFAHHTDGDWAGYSYEWDADGLNATLLTGSKTVTIGSHAWFYPSGSDCLRCHTAAAGRSLGAETAQLNRDYTYASTGRTGNQVFTFSNIGLFAAALPDTPANLPALAAPEDTGKPLADRTRAYLHANCSHCHRPGGPGRGSIDLRHTVAFSAMNICGKIPETGDLDVTDARVLYPNAPEKSVISLRMHATGTTRMPPLSSSVVDEAGTQLIDAWIRSIASCP